MKLLTQRVRSALNLTRDFYASISDDQLQMNIPGLPSNTIGEQAYCIVGARESYLNAMRRGEWVGFECSLRHVHQKTQVLEKLQSTQDQLETFFNDLTPDQIVENFMIDLLEHEVQHHGQLIRYTYANRIAFPQTWRTRYHV